MYSNCTYLTGSTATFLTNLLVCLYRNNMQNFYRVLTIHLHASNKKIYFSLQVEALRRRKTYRPPMPRPNSTGSFERMHSARSAGNTPVTLPPRSLIHRFNQRAGTASAGTTPRTAPAAKAVSSASALTTPRTSSARSAKVRHICHIRIS